MILYFSATGNSKFAAHQIAQATNDTALSMQNISEISLKDGENFGIVTPTYYWALPTIVNEILGNLKIIGGENSYIYTISTYGTTPGQSAEVIARHLKKKGLHVNASFCIKTVDSWTPFFDLSNPRKIAREQIDELTQISDILTHIGIKQSGNFMRETVPMFAANAAQKAYELARRTSHLNVNGNCIGCGICAKNCPVQAIEIKDGKPNWVKDKCVMCLQCLHKCPKFAIQYRNMTEKHGQYVHY